MQFVILLTLVCMFTYTIEIIFGLAGTILMLMIMSLFYETKQLVIYSVLPQILVASIGLIRSPKTVDLRFLMGMLGLAFAGGIVGLYLFYYFSSTTFHLMLATAISLFGLYLVISPHSFTLSPLTRSVLDVSAGISQALFGISGPIAMTRLMGTFDQKMIIRNYALAFFLTLNVFRMAAYVINGTFSPEIIQWMVISGPFLVVTLWFSNHLHFKVNEQIFKRVVSWMIFLGGLSLLLNGSGQ